MRSLAAPCNPSFSRPRTKNSADPSASPSTISAPGSSTSRPVTQKNTSSTAMAAHTTEVPVSRSRNAATSRMSSRTDGGTHSWARTRPTPARPTSSTSATVSTTCADSPARRSRTETRRALSERCGVPNP